MKRNALCAALFSIILSVNIMASAAPTTSLSASPDKSDVKVSASPSSDKKASPSPSASAKPSASPKKNDKQSSSGSDSSANENSFPVPHAKAAIVIDANSGDVIYAMNPDEKMYPAGTSNIMTAIVALENTNLSDYIEVTEEALSSITYDQPQLGLKVGESYSVEQLLYAILVNSCNDAANTLAIGVSGSIDAFVQKMNEKALELGLSNTHFANPSGLQDENHYTTAQDLAKLSQYAMKNSNFVKISSTQKYVFPATAMRSTEKTILSTNHLISRYKYPYHFYANATGIKSGNSKDAGYCLAASAVKGNLSIISVVMGCENKDVKEGAYSFTDTSKIFDYVFENYQSVLLAKKGDVIYDSKVSEAKNSTRLALTVREDVYATLKKTADPELITNQVNLTEEIKAPINQDDYFGTITYSYNGRELKTVDAVAANEVKRDFIIHIINSIVHFIFNPIVLIIIILLIAVWVRLRINRNRKRRLRHSKMASYRNGKSTRARQSGSGRTASSYGRGSSDYHSDSGSHGSSRRSTSYSRRRK